MWVSSIFLQSNINFGRQGQKQSPGQPVLPPRRKKSEGKLFGILGVDLPPSKDKRMEARRLGFWLLGFIQNEAWVKQFRVTLNNKPKSLGHGYAVITQDALSMVTTEIAEAPDDLKPRILMLSHMTLPRARAVFRQITDLFDEPKKPISSATDVWNSLR